MSDPLWRTYPDQYKRCPDCDGEGHKRCEPCHGSGHTYGPRRSLFAGKVMRTGSRYNTCTLCHGTGKLRCGRCVVGSIRL
jgi:DnaJ-class molecular chaperone